MTAKIYYKPDDKDKHQLEEGLVLSNIKNGMPTKTDCWVFEHDDCGIIIGGCKFYIFSKIAWIDQLWVDDRYKNKGYGKKLLLIAEKEAKLNGCLSSYLDTFEFQKTVKFYEKCGYRVTQKIEAMEGNDTRFFMKKNLMTSEQ